MKNSYDEPSASTIELELDDEALFTKYVVREDYDLLAIDTMLRHMFTEKMD